MPWAPMPQGGNVYKIARAMAARGASAAQIRRHLAENYGHVRQSDRTRAVTLGKKWGQRISARQRAADKGRNNTIPRSEMARGGRSERTGEPVLPSPYRYHVELQFPRTLSEMDPWRTIIIDSERNLTINEIRQEAEALFRRLLDGSPRLRQLAGRAPVGSVIVLAETRT